MEMGWRSRPRRRDRLICVCWLLLFLSQQSAQFSAQAAKWHRFVLLDGYTSILNVCKYRGSSGQVVFARLYTYWAPPSVRLIWVIVAECNDIPSISGLCCLREHTGTLLCVIQGLASFFD
jgi:hypothetical protein